MPIDEAELAVIDALWKDYGDPKAWNFVTAGLRNGDCYFALTLMREFRATSAGGARIRFLAVSRPHMAIISLFSDLIDEVVLVPFPLTWAAKVAEWRTARRKDHFAPGTLHILQHDCNYTSPSYREMMGYVMAAGNVRFIDMQKAMLRLRFQAAPDFPKVTEDARNRARALLEETGLPAGRTLILFPYAQSLRHRVLDHFAALARAAESVGLTVCTSIAPRQPQDVPDEIPVAGTVGITIPFDLLIPICELAGYAVVVRCGISDIISSATCRIVNLYQHENLKFEHSPHAFGLGGHSLDLAWDCDDQSDPAAFAAEVLRLLTSDGDVTSDALIPRLVYRHLSSPRRDAPHFEFSSRALQVTQGPYRLMPQAALAEGWSEPEPWGCWTIGHRSTLYLAQADLVTEIDAEVLTAGEPCLAMEMRFAISAEHPELHYRIEVNHNITSFRAAWPENLQTIRVPLRRSDLKGPLRVTFFIDNPLSRGPDRRILGIALIRAWYETGAAKAKAQPSTTPNIPQEILVVPRNADRLSRIDAFWTAHGDPDAWNFVTADLRNGDLYLALTLMRAFRDQRAAGRRMRILAFNRPHVAIASLFGGCVDEIVVTAASEITARDIVTWRAARGQSNQEPGTLIVLAAFSHLFDKTSHNMIVTILTSWRVCFIDLQKIVLGLPVKTAPIHPAITPEARARARALFDAAKVTEGRTLLLFPYATSFAQEARAHFAEFAKSAVAAGLEVRTSIAPGETPIDGTEGVLIPFDVLVPFCELAGFNVALRSGIGDILSSARCRVVNVYANQEIRAKNTPHAFGLGGSARDFVWDFAANPDTRAFAAAMMEALTQASPPDPEALLPPEVSGILATARRAAGPEVHFGAAHELMRVAPYRVFPGAVLAEGWSGTEPWGCWSEGHRAILYLAAPEQVASVDPVDPMFLLLEMSFALSSPAHPTLRYKIEVNEDVSVGLKAVWPERQKTLRVPLRRSAAAVPVRITFLIDNPLSPSAQSGGEGRGDGRDTRMLGIGLHRAWYEFPSPGGPGAA